MTTAQKKLRYGILSTGNIARQFAQGVQSGATLSTIHAVASRDARKADEFAKQYNIPAPHTSYDNLLKDPNVDAVYVALPNNYHHEWTIRALDAGKHVLCEKPFSIGVQQAIEMFEAAQQNNRLLAEAFMYLTHPLTHAYIDQIKSGAIGKPKLIRSSFSFSVADPDNNSRFSTTLAGGSLMDIGCYCITLTLLVADTISTPGSYPSKIQAAAHIHPSGIDDYAAVNLQFANGLIASFTCGMTAQINNASYISGTDGFIEIPIPWKPPADKATFLLGNNATPKQSKSDVTKPLPTQQTQPFTVSANKPLYALEADAFADSVLNDKPLFITPDFTLRVTRILEELRNQIGLPF
ncbi:Gfo/Idh/MocA family oxidoreductase [Planctomycetota bacterium]|nr:Gfo/Idh/MocA family oxidoreductase [Planctomycetota bacterium]